MDSCTRFETAIAGGVPDRVPAVPKIFIDLAANLTGRLLTDLLEDPQEVLMVLIEAGELCKADAVRQFHFPKRRITRVADRSYEVDSENRPIGEVDMAGGLVTLLDSPTAIDLNDPVYAAFNHFWNCRKPIIRDLDDVDRLTVPQKEFYVEYGCAERQRLAAESAGDMGLIGDCDTATMAFLVTMRGMSNAMTDLYDNPALVKKIIEKGVRIAAERGKFNIDQGLRVLRINDSVGNMSVISPAQWREFVFPHFKNLCTELHAYNSDVLLYCHICGNVGPIIEDLVDTGLDCIAPLDPLGGIPPAKFRSLVGNRVSLMGGINTLSFIQRTAEEIIEEARECIEGAGARGGFLLGSGCVVPPGAKIEALRAMTAACETFGRYGADGQLLQEVAG